MGKPYALHVAHTAYGQAICATCSAYGLRSSHMLHSAYGLIVKPYALYVVHTAYGQAICATCSAYGLWVKPYALHVDAYGLWSSHMRLHVAHTA